MLCYTQLYCTLKCFDILYFPFLYLSLLTVLHYTLLPHLIIFLNHTLIIILQPFSHYLLSFIFLTALHSTLPLYSTSFQENVRLKKEIEHEKTMREKVEMNFTAVSDVAKNLQEAENVLQNKLSKAMQVSESFTLKYRCCFHFCLSLTISLSRKHTHSLNHSLHRSLNISSVLSFILAVS